MQHFSIHTSIEMFKKWRNIFCISKWIYCALRLSLSLFYSWSVRQYYLLSSQYYWLLIHWPFSTLQVSKQTLIHRILTNLTRRIQPHLSYVIIRIIKICEKILNKKFHGVKGFAYGFLKKNRKVDALAR